MRSPLDSQNYTENYSDGVHTYTFTSPCTFTGKPYSVTVLGSELFVYNQTGSITSFASLSLSDREFIISGTSPEGWDLMMKDIDEGGDDIQVDEILDRK